jgi:pimeloyl-ACP methyl ester carboxylesterase
MLGDADETETNEIVLLIHGLNSRPEDLAALFPVIASADMCRATFRYPNDQPIDESANLLAHELRKLARARPTCKIRLVTHSMGGLVARAVVENPQLHVSNVTQLIMVAPPNHGSTLARVATFMDCYEFFSSAERRRNGILSGCVSDGLGEAAGDLEPNSVFLDQLNARQRNPLVQYTIILGTNGPMQPRELASIRETVRDYSDSSPYTRFASSKLNGALRQLDEVVDGQGDGVVSVARGQLDGVKDIVVLPFRHADVLNGSLRTSQDAYAVILERLRR